MGVYYLALPVGAALGYILGGTIAVGWGGRRSSSWSVSRVCWSRWRGWSSDPGRGASEGRAGLGTGGSAQPEEYLDLFRTPTFLYNTAGMAAVTFATGAYAAWGSTFTSEFMG